MAIDILNSNPVFAPDGQTKEYTVQFVGRDLHFIDYISGTIRANSDFLTLSNDEQRNLVLKQIKREFFPEPFNEDKIVAIASEFNDVSTRLDNEWREVKTSVDERVGDMTRRVEQVQEGAFIALEETKKQLETISKQILRSDISSEDYEQVISIYDVWEPGVYYGSGKVVRWQGKAWEVIDGKAHTSQSDWSPDIATSLFNEITPRTVEIEDGEEIEIIPDWKEPQGAHDAYEEGDKVQYDGRIWQSKIDANTTVPDADEPYNRYWEPIEQA